MENGTYHYKIEAAVPLGVRRGSMAVELHNGALSGAINLLERCSPFVDGRYKDGAVSFSGVLVTLMSELHYHAEGTLSETGIRFPDGLPGRRDRCGWRGGNGMSGEHRNATENKAMMKICAFIVDKRNLFFLLFALAIAFSAVSRGWVGVENSISAFLPDTTETRRGLSVMEREFTTFGTAKVMAANLSYAQAQALAQRLEAVEGVSAVAFDDTQEHYHNVSALFEITLDWDEADMRCLDALEQVKGVLSGYDAYLSTSLGNTASETIADEMSVIIVYVAIIVVAVLLFTSETYAEVPVLLLTFVSAAVIQMGTNFFLGTISFVSNSVTIVLQLALSVDYAIIFCHRYREEHEVLPAREAVIVALSKAIPELSASSLTTIGGLFAMTLMQFKLGPDLGIVLIKAIVISLLTVFLLMPGLLMLFSGLMDRTGHRVFVPKIPFVGKLAYATRKIVPPVFLAAVIAAAVIAGDCPYVYGYSTLTTPIQNDTQIAQQMIEDNFGGSNMVALVVPAGNYEAEGQLLRALEDREEVDSALGLANVEAMDGYRLTDRLTPRQFSELLDLDYEAAQLLYAAYAASDADYAKIVNGSPPTVFPSSIWFASSMMRWIRAISPWRPICAAPWKRPMNR